jgi:hypothetical protein
MGDFARTLNLYATTAIEALAMTIAAKRMVVWLFGGDAGGVRNSDIDFACPSVV